MKHVYGPNRSLFAEPQREDEDHDRPPVDAGRRRYCRIRNRWIEVKKAPKSIEDEEMIAARMANQWGMGDQTSLPSMNVYMTRRRGKQI